LEEAAQKFQKISTEAGEPTNADTGSGGMGQGAMQGEDGK
jgi:hypothetical protein